MAIKIPSAIVVSTVIDLLVLSAKGVKQIIEVFKKKPKKKCVQEEQGNIAKRTEESTKNIVAGGKE